MNQPPDLLSPGVVRQPFLQPYPYQIMPGRKLEAPIGDERGDVKHAERVEPQSQTYSDPILAAIASLTDQMKSMSAVLQDMREMSSKHSATLTAHAQTIHHMAAERTHPAGPVLQPMRVAMDPMSQGSTRATTPQTKGMFPNLPQAPQLFMMPRVPIMSQLPSMNPLLANPVHAYASPGQESSSIMHQSDTSPPVVRRQTGPARKPPPVRQQENVFNRLSRPKKAAVMWDESPRSPAVTARSSRSSKSAVSRLRSNSLGTGVARSVTPVASARGRSTSAGPSSRSAAAVSRGKLGVNSQPAAASVSRSKSPANVRPSSSPVIRYEVHVGYGDKVVAKAQLSPCLSQDGPFLYVIQSELSPPLCFVPSEAAAESACPFTGLSVSVVGTNTRSQRSNIVFKSHSSHVDNPPVNNADGYFSHSCWLSGPSASVVGGVRVFFKSTDKSGITLYAMSLKYWFPEDTENVIQQAPNFTKEHWKELVRLLGLL